MAVAEVCASCPESFHDEASKICLSRGIQKAFGRAGDMVNSLSGKDWVAKWEAKVVTAVVTKATTLGSSSARIICIAGGRHCDSEMAAQPRLVKAIKQEMENPDFRVRVEWMEFEDFRADTSRPQSGKTPKSANSGGEQPKGSTSSATKMCKHFSTAAGCKNGKDCTFLHVAEAPAGGSADKKSGGKGKTKGSDNTPKQQQNAQKNQPEKQQQQKQQPAQKEPSGSKNQQSGGSKGSQAPAKQNGPCNTSFLTCYICDIGFGHENEWVKHFKAEHSKDRECPECDCIFGSEKAYLDHARAKHSHIYDVLIHQPNKGAIVGNIVCPVADCDDEYQNIGKWRQHWDCEHAGFVTMDQGMRKWQCRSPGCDRLFASSLALQQHLADKGHGFLSAGPHMTSMDRGGAGQVECPGCDRVFASISALQQHMNDTGHDMMEISDGLLRCPGCDRGFASGSSLEQHMADTGHDIMVLGAPIGFFR